MTKDSAFPLPTDPRVQDQLIGLEDTNWWPVARRTPYFLERFPPEAGWRVAIKHRTGRFELPDHNQTGRFPASISSATLIDPQGRAVATATKLIPITGPDALEGGETQLRGRLYEALGLLGTIRAADEFNRRSDFNHGRNATAAKPVAGAVAPVAASEVDAEGHTASPQAAAEAASETSPQSPVEPAASDAASTTAAAPQAARQRTNLRAVADKRHATPAGISQRVQQAIAGIAKLQRIEAPAFDNEAAAQAWLNSHTGVQLAEDKA